MSDRPRYRFAGSFISPGGIPYYRWESIPNDSRGQVSCPAGWFWGDEEIEIIAKSKPPKDYWWVDYFVSGSEAFSIKQMVTAEVESAEARGWARAMRALKDGGTKELDLAARFLDVAQTQWLGK